MISTHLLNIKFLEDDNIFGKHYNQMSSYRKEKIDRMKLRKDKNLSLGAGVLLDYCLGNYGFRENLMEYETGDNGKPYFKNSPELFFNLSHSGDNVICSFADSAIGCDIEKIGEINLKIANRFFADKEKSFIFSTEDETEQLNRFYRIWTLKESYMKYSGKGFSQGLTSFEICIENGISVIDNGRKQNLYFREYEIKGYKIAVCAEKNEFSEKIHSINLI